MIEFWFNWFRRRISTFQFWPCSIFSKNLSLSKIENLILVILVTSMMFLRQFETEQEDDDTKKWPNDPIKAIFLRIQQKDWKLDELKNHQDWIFTTQKERSWLKITLLVMKHIQERLIQKNQWMSLILAMRLKKHSRIQQNDHLDLVGLGK